jgi:DNA-binding transcriptional LysR family regulator
MDQLRSMRVFTTIIDEGSFAKAAKRLDMAPAVVTRALTELEIHLGARLLNRTTRRLALTDVGEVYLLQAREVLALINQADARASTATTQLRGSLRVLCPPAFAVHQLAPLLPRFRRLYPHVELKLESPGAVNTAKDTVDVSIVSVVKNSLQGDFVARPLANSSFIACASPAYLNRCGRPQEPEDLIQHEGILPSVASVRHELTLHRWPLNSNGSESNSVTVLLPKLALATTHIDTIFAAAVSGLGIAGLPSFVAATGLRDGRLERVLPAWRGTTLQIFAAVPTRKHLPARTRAFIDFLVQAFRGKSEDPWLEEIWAD